MRLRIARGAGVRLDGLQPPMVVGLMIAACVFNDFGYECIVTSATDGRHSTGSLHHTGKGVDFRRRHLADRDVGNVVSKLIENLGDEFDVVLEDTHIHIEYDPS